MHRFETGQHHGMKHRVFLDVKVVYKQPAVYRDILYSYCVNSLQSSYI